MGWAEAIQLWAFGLALDTGAWSRFTRIPANEPGPAVAYGLVPIGAIALAVVQRFWTPTWLWSPVLLVIEHGMLIRACRRHEARRARIVENA